MSKLIGNLQKGLFFIVSAPAGTGKTTLVNRLLDEFPSIVRSVSSTTREPRAGESDGKDYHFLNEDEFKKKIDAQDFLEHVNLYGFYYGTSKSWLDGQINLGKHVVLVIDTQGGLLVREKLNAVCIFIKPPSMEELRLRLIHRQTEDMNIINKRLAWAAKEIEDSKQYDYQIVNDDLEVAYQVLKSIIIAEEHRVVRGLPGVTNGQ